MKKSVKMLMAASAILCGTATLSVSTPAMAQPAGFSFRVGDVAFAYSNGYYDHRNRWHSWRSMRERDWYRMNYRANYRNWRFDRDRDGIPNRFDRDRDNDGLVNRFDRDRDNDGVANRFDRAPNNPYRR